MDENISQTVLQDISAARADVLARIAAAAKGVGRDPAETALVAVSKVQPDDRIDAIIDNAATEVDPVKRRALYADFVRAVQTEIPLWMPIEQIFVSVFNRRIRNAGNNPRWASSTWHDTWLAS